MRSKVFKIVPPLIIICALSLLPLLSFSEDTNEKYDAKTIAQRLVNDCAQIQEGDFVWIVGGIKNAELLENIAVEVRKVGAFPLLSFGSDRLTRKMFQEVPAKYDSQTPELDLKLANLLNAIININYSEDFTLFEDIPPDRLAAVNNAQNPVNETLLKRNVQLVSLGNGLYPSDALAAQFGISKDELANVFWSGVNVDFDKLIKTGDALLKSLEKGTELHIKCKNGTDLKVLIKGRPIFLSDGVISDSDIKKGGPATRVWLPAGEVYLTPVPGTAEGKIVDDMSFLGDKEIKKLVLTFEAGKLISMEAESGLEHLKPYYEAAKGDKDLFSVIDFGINPNVSLIPNSKMECWMSSGMVTVGTGQNTWAGGDNDATFGLVNFLTNCTVELDGKILVDKGVLQF